jgi:hypothetical protein
MFWRDRTGRIHIDAGDARGGEIEFRSPLSRGIFIAGLVGMVIAAALLG